MTLTVKLHDGDGDDDFLQDVVVAVVVVVDDDDDDVGVVHFVDTVEGVYVVAVHVHVHVLHVVVVFVDVHVDKTLHVVDVAVDVVDDEFVGLVDILQRVVDAVDVEMLMCLIDRCVERQPLNLRRVDYKTAVLASATDDRPSCPTSDYYMT